MPSSRAFSARTLAAVHSCRRSRGGSTLTPVSALSCWGHRVLRSILCLVKPLIKDAGDEQRNDPQWQSEKDNRQHKTNKHFQHDARARDFFAFLPSRRPAK